MRASAGRSWAPEHGVRCIAWWSKDYSEWLRAWDNPATHDLLARFDAHYFNFTVNGEQSILEPGLTTTLDERLAQVRRLAEIFTPAAVLLRFDPICFYTVGGGSERNNLGDFKKIIEAAAACGVTRVATAFYDHYPQVAKRALANAGIRFSVLQPERRAEIMRPLAALAHSVGVTLEMCGQALPGGVPFIAQSSCISSVAIDSVLHARGHMALRRHGKETGSHEKCHCVASREIGGYGLKCLHGCEYCYVNAQPGSHVKVDIEDF